MGDDLVSRVKLVPVLILSALVGIPGLSYICYKKGVEEGKKEGARIEGTAYEIGHNRPQYLGDEITAEITLAEMGGITYLVRSDVLRLRELGISPEPFSNRPEFSPAIKVKGIRVVSSEERAWKDESYRGHFYEVNDDKLVEAREPSK
jgi:hypothetical protein